MEQTMDEIGHLQPFEKTLGCFSESLTTRVDPRIYKSIPGVEYRDGIFSIRADFPLSGSDSEDISILIAKYEQLYDDAEISIAQQSIKNSSIKICNIVRNTLQYQIDSYAAQLTRYESIKSKMTLEYDETMRNLITKTQQAIDLCRRFQEQTKTAQQYIAKSISEGTDHSIEKIDQETRFTEEEYTRTGEEI